MISEEMNGTLKLTNIFFSIFLNYFPIYIKVEDMNHFDIDHTLIKMECSVHFYSGLCASLLTQVTLIQIKGSLKKREGKEYVFGSASFGLKCIRLWGFNNHQIARFRVF